MLRQFLRPLLACLIVVSCKDAAGPEDLTGIWRLETVSGQSLPFLLEQDGSFKVELTGETVELLASGRQTTVTFFRVTDGGIVTNESVPAPGNYTVNGSTLLFTFDNDTDTYTAVVNGDLMTINDIGLTFVYRRE
jgi:hypothetical protein